MRDAIDLGAAVLHASLDIAAWPITKNLSGIELKPGFSTDASCGVRPIVDVTGWPDVIPPGWDGPLCYTLWLFLRHEGQWHGAAIIEFWRDRQWTGAPLLTQFRDWVYGPWGDMQTYGPGQGDTVGFMVTAGDLRLHKDILTVQERSQTVTCTLVPQALYIFPTDDPLPPVTPPPPTDELADRVAKLEAKLALLGDPATVAHLGGKVLVSGNVKYLGHVEVTGTIVTTVAP